MTLGGSKFDLGWGGAFMVANGLTVIALDIDGVVNGMGSFRVERMARVDVGRWTIRWRPPVVERLKELLDRPDVEGAWLTTWLEQPWLLDDFEHALGLIGLVPHRADHPAVQTQSGHTIIDHRFEDDVAFHPTTTRWWKRHAAEMLVRRLQPARFAWIDDDLGRSAFGDDPWRRRETYDRFLLRTAALSGLLSGDVDRLERWLHISDERACNPSE
ncbi:HAD domain-containing protein [Microbacterium sp.]|uniref:HAD domain-containing protein n=1 Tax=Microbacterium sp. TaxID=51671 RepID=UPI002736D31A|nr:HAD domain-containing protein [Microbacterium sp.]MDP3949509.1 HAD domain-containing protein [Microbacterium sp.]